MLKPVNEGKIILLNIMEIGERKGAHRHLRSGQGKEEQVKKALREPST